MKIKYIGKKKIKIKLDEYWHYRDEKEIPDAYANYLLNDETYKRLFIKIEENKPLENKPLENKPLDNKVTKKLKEK